MAKNNTIELFLSSNASMPAKPVMEGLLQVTQRTQYRPDKLFPRDGTMKWNMIYNNIDTPHKLSNSRVLRLVDPTWLATELNELEDFTL